MTTTRYTDRTVRTISPAVSPAVSPAAKLHDTVASLSPLHDTMESPELTMGFAWAPGALGVPEAEPRPSFDRPNTQVRPIPAMPAGKPSSPRNARPLTGAIAGALGTGAVLGLLLFVYTDSAEPPSVAVAPGVVATPDSGHVPASVVANPPAVNAAPAPARVVTITGAAPASGGGGAGKGGGGAPKR